MKFFTCEQIREIDQSTITSEPVASIDLMERASRQLFVWITARFDRSHRILVFAGPGNNGGDGLALARMLWESSYRTEVFYIKFTDKVSPDWEINRSRLTSLTDVPFRTIESQDQFPVIFENDIIVDAIFGSGLKRPAEGLPASTIKNINKTDCTKISVDIPSGLFGEDNSQNIPEFIIGADYTLSFQFPKLSFMFSENQRFTGEWFILPIELDAHSINNIGSPYRYIETKEIARLLKKRGRFDHKGNFGHGLLIAGSTGKTGAAILGARAALRTGMGLLTCQVPDCAEIALHSTVPEAMVVKDHSHDMITDIKDTGIYTAAAIGPGLGTAKDTQNAIYRFIHEFRKPFVIDADAINIFGMNKDWFSYLHKDIILTPHPKEFERIAGSSGNGFERLMKQINFSRNHNCVIVLKGANTSVSMPDGRVFFNSTGNPGMATAGSGDVLTGILLSLLAQDYRADEAALLGVYLHGLAGDIAAEDSCMESMIASDIINCIGRAFNRIREAVI